MVKKVKKGVFDDPAAFRQRLRMAAVQVLGLSAQELALALAYELEPSSGIPAAEAEVEYKPVADPDESFRVFDVAVRSRARFGKAAGDLARFLLPAVIFGGVVLSALVIDYGRLALAERSLTRERSVRAPLDAQVRRLQNVARTKRAAAEALRADREAAVRAQNRAAAYRAAEGAALTALAEACDSAAVIASLASPDDFSLEVTGTALSAQAAAGVMEALAARAATIGWAFHPGRIERGARGTTATFTGGLIHD